MVRGVNHIDPNFIVEPGQSDRAAFDADAYHRAMRDGRNEGVVHYFVAFVLGLSLGFVASYLTGIGVPQYAGLIAGGAGIAVLRSIRARKIAQSNADAVALHAEAHDLRAEAHRLEVEAAKSSGAFARWEQS